MHIRNPNLIEISNDRASKHFAACEKADPIAASGRGVTGDAIAAGLAPLTEQA